MAKRQGTSTPKGQSSNSKKTNVAKKGASTAKSETFESKPRKAHAVKPQAGETRAAAEAPKKKGAIKRVAGAITRAVSKLRPGRKREAAVEAADREQLPRKAKKAEGQTAARAPKRTTDIPMDVLANTYTPQQTSLKGPFRTSGADRQHDQEMTRGVVDDRFNDEDILTNKSGDPRIGTHGRTYEPGEARAAKGDVRDYETE